MQNLFTWKNLGWVLTAVLTFMLGASGVSKVIGTEEMVKTFEFLKLTPYMKWIGMEFLQVQYLLLNLKDLPECL